GQRQGEGVRGRPRRAGEGTARSVRQGEEDPRAGAQGSEPGESEPGEAGAAGQRGRGEMTLGSGPVGASRWSRLAPGFAVSRLAASWNAVLALAVAGLCAPAQAQEKPQPGTTKNDEDVVKAGTKDPYTDGEPKLMADARIVAYAPFPWADGQRTTDLDR